MSRLRLLALALLLVSLAVAPTSALTKDQAIHKADQGCLVRRHRWPVYMSVGYTIINRDPVLAQFMSHKSGYLAYTPIYNFEWWWEPNSRDWEVERCGWPTVVSLDSKSFPVLR